jgi:hypothetical protein
MKNDLSLETKVCGLVKTDHCTKERGVDCPICCQYLSRVLKNSERDGTGTKLRRHYNNET